MSSSSSSPDPGHVNDLHQKLGATLDLKFRQFVKADNAAARVSLIAHWHLWQDHHKQQLLESDWVLTDAIRKALFDSDLQTKANAFEAMQDLVDFDLMSDLIKITIQPNYAHKESSAQALTRLATELFQQAQGEDGAEDDATSFRYRWPANRQHLRDQLEKALEHYRQHRRIEILLAYLLFSDYSDPCIKRILTLETHEAHGDLLGLLFENRSQPMVDKLAGFVSVANPPMKLSRLWIKRKDWPFVTAFLSAIAEGAENVVHNNLRRIEQPVWLEMAFSRIRELSVEQQSALLKVISHGVRDLDQKLELKMRILSVADLPVRRQTIRLICEQQGIRANKVVSYLVDQEQDAESLAILLPELRRRNIQGAMKRLLVFLDHSNPKVRTAAGEAFQDCRVGRYIAAFDMLTESVRVSTGQLVYKVDPNTNRVLTDELNCAARPRRLRALIAIRSIGNVEDVQASVLRCLSDDDPKIREAAAGTLATCHTIEAQRQLRNSLMDQHPKVRKAAERSLQKLAENSGQGSD